jgi:hypothetical protein
LHDHEIPQTEIEARAPSCHCALLGVRNSQVVEVMHLMMCRQRRGAHRHRRVVALMKTTYRRLPHAVHRAACYSKMI